MESMESKKAEGNWNVENSRPRIKEADHSQLQQDNTEGISK